jgi:hypothetical protein
VARLAQTSAGTNIRVTRLRARQTVILVLPRLNPSILQRRVGELGIKVGYRFVRVDNRFERRSNLLLVQQVPVDRREEWVGLQLVGAVSGAKSVEGVSVEQLTVRLPTRYFNTKLTPLTNCLPSSPITACQLEPSQSFQPQHTMLGEANLAVANQSVHLLSVLRVEWTPAAAHLKEQDTQ